MRLGAVTGRRFWKTRRDRITSALLALLLAFLLGFFVLGRGPGTLIWLTGSRLTWLPFVGAGLSWLPAPLDWLPLGAKASGTGLGQTSSGAGPAASGPGSQSPNASSTPTPSHGPGAGAVATPTPRPSAGPTGAPTATPTPAGGIPGFATPTPSGVATATPTPTPIYTYTPNPTPIPTAIPTPTPTPIPTPTPTPFVPVLLYSDNFSSDLALGLLPPSGWTNEPSVLLGGYTVVVDGGNVMRGPAGTTGFPSAIAGSASWTDDTVAADVKVDPTNGHARVIARHQSAGNYYACGLDAGQNLYLGKRVGGTWTTIGSNGYSFNGTTWYHVDFAVQGNSLTCTVNEPGTGHSRTLTATAGDFPAGSIGATGEYGSEYRNFVVTSLP
jgi:hypothetical protein